MNKVYSRINWENEPSTKTPLNEHNLNKIDFAVDEIDNRVIELDSTKAKNTDLQTLSTRVDNLILNAGDSSAECTDARVTEDGTTYDTLKKRLDAEHSSVIEDISQLSEEIDDVDFLFDWEKEKTNLLNECEPVVGYYVDYASGASGVNSSYQYYQRPVNAGESYKCDKDELHIAFFSEFYTGYTVEYRVGGLLSKKQESFVVPENAKYMTVSTEIDSDTWLGYGNVPCLDIARLKEKHLPDLSKIIRNVLGIGKTIIVGGSDGSYSNLVKAILESEENTTIIVRSGIYDLESQFKEVYGNDFFDNYQGYTAESDWDMSGLYLKRGVKLIGDSGVILSFMYSGNNPKVAEEFSPINMSMDNIVDGVIIEVNSNVRYHIHDDFAFMAFMNINNYGCNEIKNCIFKGNPTSGSAIGGGMGTYCKYFVHDNYFDNTIGNAISYHNASFSVAQNFIDIYNNFATTPIKLQCYGASSKITTALVHNNKASLIECNHNLSNDAPYENIKMKAWNNSIG